MSYQPIRFYQTGTFTVGNRLLPTSSVGAADMPAPTRSTPDTAPAGLRRGARRAVCDRRGHGGDESPARGCDATAASRCSRRRTGDLLAESVDPLAVRQRGAVATGIAAAMRVKGRETARRRAGRDAHHGHRLWLPVGDVRAQRRRALHLLRQRGVHNTACSAPRRRPPARTNTTFPWATRPATASGRARTCR